MQGDQNNHNFRFYEVFDVPELEDLMVEPPAIAYVRTVGDFYFRHFPSYWLGLPGEASQWIRIGYSGGLSQILATNHSYLSGVAQTLLARLVSDGYSDFNWNLYRNYVQNGGGFYQTAAELWMQAHNYQLAELNDRACGPTEGDHVLKINDGDILLERGQAYCIQEKTLILDEPMTKYKRDIKYIGMQPLCERPVNGIVRQYAKTGYRSFNDTQDLPIGFIVSDSAIPAGATSFTAAIHPGSVPKPESGGGKRWYKYTQGQLAGVPNPSVLPPGGFYDTDKPWDIRKFAWIQAPYNSLSIPVQDFSGLSTGEMPQALDSTLTLSSPCPMPLLYGGLVRESSRDTWFVGKPTRSFGFMPTGVYGGELGATSFSIRPRAHSNERILGPTGSEFIANMGSKTLELYRSWQGLVGQRRFSRFRGIQKDDFVSIDNFNFLYRVSAVSNSANFEPSTLTLSTGLKAHVGEATVNNNGYSLARARAYYVPNKFTEPMVFETLGWGSPDGNSGIPLIIKNINFNTVTLMAPVAKTIPAGTRMPVWLSSDLDSACYAYHDFYRFMHELEQYITVQEVLGIDSIREKIAEVNELKMILARAQNQAAIAARTLWFTPPYMQNTRIDDSLPPEFSYYGGTFSEVNEELTYITNQLVALAATRLPSWNVVEYMSLLQYNQYVEVL